MRSSSLTFYTLLSIVPLLALAFAIAKGFGLQEALKDEILENFGSDRAILSQIIVFSDRLLDQTKGGVIAGAGSLLLFWSATSLLASMEAAFNKVWKVKRLRSWRRLISDYFAMILIAPLLFLLSGSLSLYLSGLLREAIGDALGDAGLLFIQWIPYVLLWLLYTLIYFLLPNTKVQFSAALAGGLVAGALSLIAQSAYFYFQASVSHYSAVYGSFAALPLFLIWLQINWFLLLFGVEISHAAQTQEQWEFGFLAGKMSYTLRLTVALWVAKIAARLTLESKQLFLPALVEEHAIPFPIAQEAVKQLCDAGILAELKEQDVYLLRKDVHSLRISDVIDALQHIGSSSLDGFGQEGLKRLHRLVCEFGRQIASSAHNIYLKDL